MERKKNMQLQRLPLISCTGSVAALETAEVAFMNWFHFIWLQIVFTDLTNNIETFSISIVVQMLVWMTAF